MRILIAAILLPLALFAFRASGTAPSPQSQKADPAARLDREFRDTVLPFVQTYCTGCHGAEKPKADVDLAAFASVESVAKNHKQWVAVRDQLKDKTRQTIVSGAPDPAWQRDWLRWLMLGITGVLCLEWLLRRLWRLA